MKKGVKYDREKLYPNVYIYKIVCKDPAIMKFYIGATTNLYQRKAQHVNSSKTKTTPVYEFIKHFGGWENWKFEIIEQLKYKTLDQKKEVEKKYIDFYKPHLNKNVIGRTFKQYVNDNKERIYTQNKINRLRNLEKRRKYLRDRYAREKEKYQKKGRENYQNNKEKIKERNGMGLHCLCGCKIRLGDRKIHYKSQKHKTLLKKIFEDVNV